MERKLRKSQFNDYVAVDIIEADGTIVRTPVYLEKGKPKELFWIDRETGERIPTMVKFNGEKLECEDHTGFIWVSEVEELLTEI